MDPQCSLCDHEEFLYNLIPLLTANDSGFAQGFPFPSLPEAGAYHYPPPRGVCTLIGLSTFCDCFLLCEFEEIRRGQVPRRERKSEKAAPEAGQNHFCYSRSDWPLNNLFCDFLYVPRCELSYCMPPQVVSGYKDRVQGSHISSKR